MLSQPTKYTIVLAGALLILGSAALTATSTAEQRQPIAEPPVADLINQGNFPVSVAPSDSVAAESSPLVADVDNDGDYELFMAGYTWSGGPTDSAQVHGWDHSRIDRPAQSR